MAFVLTNDTLKEFLVPGTDVAVRILSMVRDTPEVSPPLQSAAGRALFIADTVKVSITLSADWSAF